MEAPTNTQLNPYLTFDGNCEEAMNFYHSILGGEITMKSTFGEGPMEVAETHKNRIMHMTLVFDGCSLLASDTAGEPALVSGNNFNLSVYLPGKEKATEVMNKLSAGGKVTMPFNEVFWGGSFGMLEDKYGTQWMVSCP